MGKINIKNGTPLGWASLCTTCSWAHMVTGFRESELLIVCTDTNPNVAIPFKVQSCSCYLDKNRPNYDQMEKLAIDILPVSSAKAVGFRPRVAVVEDEAIEVARK
jgi:hypothetical protein